MSGLIIHFPWTLFVSYQLLKARPQSFAISSKFELASPLVKNLFLRKHTLSEGDENKWGFGSLLRLNFEY